MKSKLVLRPHLKIRLKERKIPQNYPFKVLENPDSRYFDKATKRFIALKELEYHKKLKPMVVVYDIIDTVIQIITIHPTSKQEIQNKLKSGRWTKYEKN